jgi:methyl-accepting chemotaxis protein
MHTGMREKLKHPAARLIALIGLIVVLLGVAVGVSVWRFGSASESKDRALEESQVQTVAQRARTALARRGGLVDAYGGDKDPADLRDIESARNDLSRSLIALRPHVGSDAKEARELDAVVAGDRRLRATFEKKVRPVAGTPDFDRGVKPYAAQLDTVAALLDRFAADSGVEARKAAASAKTDERNARLAAILAGLLAFGVAIFTGLYCRKLLGGMFGQIDGQLGQIDRQMDEIGKIRMTAGELGVAAGEMRAAATESASATSEQSAAISEAAATIEQLNATASSIAESTRAGSNAAEQTGDTMRDMQEQVEAISARSLTLGERSQKITEVLELINDIAEQTNLLALNAAIEAARAGDAGRGFAVVASEVRKLAERSIRSTESIQEIIAGVQDETNATIMATEQGAKQAREVGDLMGSTVEVLEESLRATDQQKEAADQVSSAMVEIRGAAEQLAADQEQRATTAQRVDTLVEELERKLVDLSSAGGDHVALAPAGNGSRAG